MLNKTLSPVQAIGFGILGVGLLALLLWAATNARGVAGPAARAVEMPAVREQVTGEAPSGAQQPPPTSHQQAIERERLENMKFGLRQGNKETP